MLKKIYNKLESLTFNTPRPALFLFALVPDIFVSLSIIYISAHFFNEGHHKIALAIQMLYFFTVGKISAKIQKFKTKVHERYNQQKIKYDMQNFFGKKAPNYLEVKNCSKKEFLPEKAQEENKEKQFNF